MKLENRYLIFYFLFLFFSNTVYLQEFPVLKGEYLGQKPPGITPEIFAPGIISTDKVELNAVFSTDGNEFYFTRKDTSGLFKIMQMKQVNNRWAYPQTAPFSGIYEEADPFISPDGKLFFYISKKPEEGFGPPHDILIMFKTGSGWSEPSNPGLPLNTEYNEIYPSISSKGTLYFNSNRPGGFGKRDIYRSTYKGGKFSLPKIVGKPISSEYNEGDILIAPDESYLIFVSADRPDSYGSGDLYICFRTDRNIWSEPINMGDSINSEGYDYSPIVTHDGKYFFFTKYNDIYWVDAKIIDIIKSTHLKK